MPKRKLNNVTQRKDGRWEARKVFGNKPDGSPNRKSFFGATAAEAAEKLAAYEKQVENGLNVEAESLTLEQWIKTWMREYKLKTVRAKTFDTYDILIRFNIIPVLGQHKLLKLRPEHLQAFINGLKKENGEAPSLATLQKIKHVLSGALGQALKNGLITRNPVTAITLPKRSSRKKIGAFTSTEQTSLLSVANNHRLSTLFVLALGTGMRIGELLALRWSDVDIGQGGVTVSASLSRSKDRKSTGEAIKTSLKIEEPKTRSGHRVIPLTLEVKQALIKHREAQAAERLRAGSAWVKNDLVFCTQLGGYLGYRNVTRLYEGFRDRAGLPKLTFHCLRHTFVTNAIGAGMDYFYLSKIAGHSNISVTLGVYAEFMPDKSRSEMKKMEDVLLLKLA